MVSKDGVSTPSVSRGLNGVLRSIAVDSWLKSRFRSVCVFAKVLGYGFEVRLGFIAPRDVGGIYVAILEILVDEVGVSGVELAQGVFDDGLCDFVEWYIVNLYVGRGLPALMTWSERSAGLRRRSTGTWS